MENKNFWPFRLKLSKDAISLIIALLVMGTIFYFTEWPRPLVLADPPFPRGSLASYEETSKRAWYSGNTPSDPESHVWRKEYVIGLGGCCENLNSPEKIFAFMEEWMNSQGWVRWTEIGDPCSEMDEAEFLERDTEYIPYVPIGTKNLLTAPSVCIAVWLWKDDNIFAVLIVTSKQ